jgi:hypothetical protein
MPILRKPGSIVACYLPMEMRRPVNERMIVHLRIPDRTMYAELESILGLDGLSSFEVARRVVGLSVDRIENLKYPDGSDFQLDREKSGYLTPDCAEWLTPYLQAMTNLVTTTTELSEADRKNS